MIFVEEAVQLLTYMQTASIYLAPNLETLSRALQFPCVTIESREFDMMDTPGDPSVNVASTVK